MHVPGYEDCSGGGGFLGPQQTRGRATHGGIDGDQALTARVQAGQLQFTAGRCDAQTQGECVVKSHVIPKI